METTVIGAVEYRISNDEKDVIHARYFSTASMAQVPGKICQGRAVGDTSNGFPGEYIIQYFGVNDELVGEFNWIIKEQGEGFSLSWTNRKTNSHIAADENIEVLSGFGFATSDDSIVVAYWMTEAVTLAMQSQT